MRQSTRDTERWVCQPVPINGGLIYSYPAQELINATQFCTCQGIEKYRLRVAVNKMGVNFKPLRGFSADLQGTYVSYKDMKKPCIFLGLREDILNAALRQISEIRPQIHTPMTFFVTIHKEELLYFQKTAHSPLSKP